MGAVGLVSVSWNRVLIEEKEIVKLWVMWK